MKKRFIVLTDLSTPSERLVQFAATWADKAGAELVVAHQAAVFAPAMGDAEIRSEIKRRNKQSALRTLQDFTKQVLGNIRNVKFHVTTSKIETSLARLNNSKNLDVIFVGIKKEKSFIENLLTESTAIKLSSEINKIIISIPVDTVDYNFESLCIGLKHAYPINETEFTNLLTIATPMFSSIQLLSVTEQEEQNGEAEMFLSSVAHEHQSQAKLSYKVAHTASIPVHLSDYVEGNSMLAIQKGPRSLFDIFRKYHVNELLKNGHIPLIILPNNE